MTEEKKSNGTVTIACKHPHGLIMRIFKTTERPEPVLGGGTRMVPVSEPIPGKEITIYGPGRAVGQDPKCLIVAGYAINTGIDRDFWDQWKAQNADSDLLKNRLVFAYATPESAQAAAREHAKTRSGLEPLDMSMKSVKGPDGTPRMVASDDRVPRAPGLTIQREGTAVSTG
jgi:hypothetical protein